VIVGGEIAIGLGLVLGAFVGLAAAGGLMMNMAFLLAGTVSTNPVLVMLGVRLILAWKNAGYTLGWIAICCRCSARPGTAATPSAARFSHSHPSAAAEPAA
jgi:hypothetical protein